MQIIVGIFLFTDTAFIQTETSTLSGSFTSGSVIIDETSSGCSEVNVTQISLTSKRSTKNKISWHHCDFQEAVVRNFLETLSHLG